MNLKLSHKIFIVFSTMALMVVILMIGLIWFYFSSNFADYSNRIMLGKYEDVTVALAIEYQTQGSWQALKKSPRQWENILWSNLPHKGESPDFAALVEFKTHRLAVFNDSLQHIAGGHSLDHEDYTLDKITVKGKTVGWFGPHKSEYLSNPMAKGFLIQQLHGLNFIGGGILLLAAIVTFLLSRHLLKPIKELTAGTHALSLRQFDTRITLRSGDEFGQLAKDFNHMAKTLKHYENMRRQWISDIAHELRTPLLILSGEIEALKDGIRELNIPAMKSLYSEAQHLGKIVNDLHELSLADSGALTINKVPVDPMSVLQDTLGHFKSLFGEHNIRIEDLTPCTPTVKILGDETRLKQLFSNLFQNSLIYTDKPGVLRIEFEINEEHVNVYVEDSGPGVPEKDLPLLFDRLHRVDKSRNRAYGGSGLGLSICKSIVEAFNGTILAVNGDSGGLRIVISFRRIK